MPTLNGNYIDLLIIIVLALYIAEGIERGFWVLIGDLVSFLGSFAIALRSYSIASSFLVTNFNLPHSFANALGFILVAMISQIILGNLIGRAIDKIPEKFWKNWLSRTLSIVPAIVDGSVLVGAFLILLVSIPISPRVKNDVIDSKIGGFYINQISTIEKELANIFGDALQDTLTFLTIKPNSQERIDIPYKPNNLTIDESSEAKMFELVNAERAKVGVKQLKLDQTIIPIARAYSRDMWERGYFAHVNPDGKDPFDRMEEGRVVFLVAGENLALAPTVGLAHRGLMNSTGHRRNILDPSFGRIGIGIVDGGIYGKMFTQNFAD
ncbi:MAG: CvpA family protein [Candidatus Blackburnbacteria bacterium]|nr:CvpA family protein [Candidatus Blackburnbacteria bacterium]